jgi:hypothetical protein
VENTSKIRLTDREIFYFRQRQRKRFFQSVIAAFAARAEKYGLTKSDLAAALKKDRSQISRWFSGPGNWELDTISDMLLTMRCELDIRVVALDEPDPISNADVVEFLEWAVSTKQPKIDDRQGPKSALDALNRVPQRIGSLHDRGEGHATALSQVG